MRYSTRTHVQLYKLQAMYNNAHSRFKKTARNIIHRAVDKYLGRRNELKILSLPADNFYFEEILREKYPYSIIDTVEYKEEIYKKGLAKAKRLNILHMNADVFRYLSVSDVKYDFIWLDLCGNIGNKLINNLIPVVQGNNTKDSALIALTVSARREHLAKHKELYNFNTLREYRDSGLIRDLKLFARMNNRSLSCKRKYTYLSDRNMPMYLYLFTLNNKQK